MSMNTNINLINIENRDSLNYGFFIALKQKVYFIISK